jgi:hypothetical protein
VLQYSYGYIEESPVAPYATLALSAIYLLLFASLTGTRVHTDAAACTVVSIKIPTEADSIQKIQFGIPITQATWKFGQGEKNTNI